MSVALSEVRERVLTAAVACQIDPSAGQVLSRAETFERWVLRLSRKQARDSRALEARVRAIELSVEVHVTRRFQVGSTWRQTDLRVNEAQIVATAEQFAAYMLADAGSANGEALEKEEAA